MASAPYWELSLGCSIDRGAPTVLGPVAAEGWFGAESRSKTFFCLSRREIKSSAGAPEA